ncbi:hypothetical protein [Nostoc sp.]
MGKTTMIRQIAKRSDWDL